MKRGNFLESGAGVAAVVAPRPSGFAQRSLKLDAVHIGRVATIIFQLGLLILLIRLFQIEGRAFLELMVLACGGFVVHHFLPGKYRLPFFAGLSVAGIAVVLGVANCAWIVGLGGVLIGLAHAPVAFRARVALVGLMAAAMVAMRSEWMPAPWPSVIWPVVGSMFMFRLIVYMYDMKNKTVPFGFWRATAYFFMLPNVCFPMFPVVDYETFCRNHYNDADEFRIYQSGIVWMFRGVLQLLGYRLITQNFMVDLAKVTDAGQAAQYILTTFLIYLYISGSFHLIVGVLHLFGFNLHETHHNYLLSSSFTDFWRRINIYWKDFIQKIVFTPMYFWLSRRIGGTSAIVWATACAFLFTWMLHSYQWFWIRGDFPLTWQDGVFWGLLGVLVLTNMLYEMKHGRKRRLKKTTKTVRSELGVALRTIGTFVVICVSWTVWTAPSFADVALTATALTQMTASNAAWIVTALLGIGVAAVVAGRTAREQTDLSAEGTTGRPPVPLWRSAGTVSVLCGVILLVGQRPLYLSSIPTMAAGMERLKDPYHLGDRDADLLERGYYEDLTNTSRYNMELAKLYGHRPEDWNRNEAIYETGGYPAYAYLPGASVQFKGAPFSTNQWGLRDKEYDKQKPPGTVRIALLGASHSLGAGVADGQTYETFAEEMLNRECTSEHVRKFEILNFSVSGYGPLCRLELLREKVFDFDPDVVIVAEINAFKWIIGEAAYIAANDVATRTKAYVKQVAARAGVEAGEEDLIMRQKFYRIGHDLVRWYFDQVVAECERRDGVRVYAMFVPRPQRRSVDAAWELTDQVRLAKEAGLHVLDLNGAYDSAKSFSSLWVAQWDRHPNPTGHRMLAAKFYETLREELADVLTGPEKAGGDRPDLHADKGRAEPLLVGVDGY